MKRLNQLFLAAAVAFPLIASAQTSTGTPSSMEKAPSPNIKPVEPTSGDAMAKDTKKMKRKAPKGTQGAPVGEVPSYPAPAKDGTPTK